MLHVVQTPRGVFIGTIAVENHGAIALDNACFLSHVNGEEVDAFAIATDKGGPGGQPAYMYAKFSAQTPRVVLYAPNIMTVQVRGDLVEGISEKMYLRSLYPVTP